MIRKSLAIIGTGIAGMACGYFLRDRFDIAFYEKNHTPGGHTNTLTIDEGGEPIFIDTGFMVYNEITYPHLTRLFRELDVRTKPTSMSFSVQHVPSGLEYCGTGIDGLFAQRRNILNPRFLRLLRQIHRFNCEAPKIFEDARYAHTTLAAFVEEKKLGNDFLDLYLLPMSSAIWSTPSGRILEFPAITLIRFFKNHGLLGLKTHHPWRTVAGGSRVYRDKLLGSFKEKVWLNHAVTEITRETDKVAVRDAQGEKKIFDHVILATHGDEALQILKNPTAEEERLLSQFSYQKNKALLHTDSSVMPHTRRAWSSWNVRLEHKSGAFRPSTTYFMNSLQQVSKNKNYFVSINDPGNVEPKKILWETDYTHPIFNLAAVKAQSQLPTLNQDGRIYFCGSYFRYGFHEDALDSALQVARVLGGAKGWE